MKLDNEESPAANSGGMTSLFGHRSIRWQIRVVCAAVALASMAGACPWRADGVSLAVMVAGLATVIGCLFLEHRIAKPLALLLESAQGVASGRVVHADPLDRLDEIGLLQRAIDQSAQNLLAILWTLDDHHDSESASPLLPLFGRPRNEALPAAIRQVTSAIDRMGQQRHLDVLTGVYSRAGLAEKLRKIQRRTQTGSNAPASLPVVGLLFIDVDNFKAINDGYGHDTGDRVLVAVAERLRRSVRATDFVARYGGDEFCVLMDDTGTGTNIRGMEQKLHEAIGRGIDLESITVDVSISVGSSILGVDADDIGSLLTVADKRMLEVKARRKGTQVIHRTIGSDSPYGPACVLPLMLFVREIRTSIQSIVERFYEQLATLPGSDSLIKALSEPQLEHLKSQQMQNMLALASPHLTEEQHRDIALRTGRIHAIVGLSRRDLVRAYDILDRVIRTRVDTTRHSEALSLVGRRLIREFGWQMEAFQTLDSGRQLLLLDIADIAHKAGNYGDLFSEVTEKLAAYEEISGCAIGSPDSQGVIRFDFIAGSNAERFIISAETAGLLPSFMSDDGAESMWQTWRSGQIQHCINFANAPDMETWRSLAESSGLRSCASIPLCDDHSNLQLVLVLFSTLPGGYSSTDYMTFLAQLRSSIMFALHRLTVKKGAKPVLPYNARWHMTTLLRSGALEMYYQPILELRSNEVMKVEALARLRDGDRVLTPAEFFPAFSDDDLFELYVRGLQLVLKQRNRWLKQGLDIRVAVNLPPSSLVDPRYYDSTLQTLKEHDCKPEYLTLEILETEEISSMVDVAKTLMKFKELGVHLSEDDLGSGYSSLNRLHKLPFDTIKIDRSIVAPAAENSQNVLPFIYQLTRLGHSLGKTVVIEGVEDRDLIEAARILGVDAAQGYAVARPMPAQQFTEWLESRLADCVPERQTHCALTELARFLLWEEQLHMLLNPPSASGNYLRGISREAIPVLSLDCIDLDVEHSVVSAALDHGLQSPRYRAVREQVLATLTSGNQ